MGFARLGGLSPVKYDRVKDQAQGYSYPPPRRKGIYAFIWPYLSPFFYMWKVSRILERKGLESWDSERDCATRESNKYFRIIGYRVFDYEGPIWTHLGKEGIGDSWQKVSTDKLSTLFKREKHLLNKDLMTQYRSESWGPLHISQSVSDDPFKRGRGGMFAKDHLEVFIEKKDLGKIR